jgi:hypothetical protein
MIIWKYTFNVAKSENKEKIAVKNEEMKRKWRRKPES